MYSPKFADLPLVKSIRQDFDGSIFQQLRTNKRNYVSGGSDPYWTKYQYVVRVGMILYASNRHWLMTVLVGGEPFDSPGYGKALLDFALSIRPTKGDRAFLENFLTKAANRRPD